MSDEQAMQRALLLALRGSGYVSPNPRVGCVIVRDNRIIAEGWHGVYGSLHAEADAIANTSEDLAGATLYVNLEPCAHEGKQPPCAPLIIQNKISRVVVGIEDPYSKVQGRGVAMLREAGIEVSIGVLADECAWVNRAFIKYITTGQPYIASKIAQTIDACIATSDGESQWITGEESRRRAHILRAEFDAVLIGKSTAQTDNPSLNVRLIQGRDPRRIVFDTKLAAPLELKILSDVKRSDTIVVCDKKFANNRKARNLREAGVEVVGVGTDSRGLIDEQEALYALSSEYGIASILLEGGGQIMSSFLYKNLIDEFHFFIAPSIMGGGKRTFNGIAADRLSNMLRLTTKFASRSGEDMHLIAVREQ